MSSESSLSLAEIKAIKRIHCLRDLILNLIFYYIVDETIKEQSQKKPPNKQKKTPENLFISTAFIVGMLEIKNVGMVFSASFKERLREKMLLRSNIQQFVLWWWSHSEILPFFFFFGLAVLFLIFHWFIGSSLSEKSGIFVTTLKSLFSPQTLAVISVTCTKSETKLG